MDEIAKHRQAYCVVMDSDRIKSYQGESTRQQADVIKR